MKIRKINEMKGGWFIGDFEPSVLKTDLFEVAFHIHKKGEEHDVHYHAIATEYNVLIEGKMKIAGQVLQSGDIFIMEPNEIADPVFLEDCKIICVKTPSVMGDKYLVDNKSRKEL